MPLAVTTKGLVFALCTLVRPGRAGKCLGVPDANDEEMKWNPKLELKPKLEAEL